jgi:hypothetical protein
MTPVVSEDDANPVRNTDPRDNNFIYLFYKNIRLIQNLAKLTTTAVAVGANRMGHSS